MFAIAGAALGAGIAGVTGASLLTGAALGGIAGSALGSYVGGQNAAGSAEQAAQTQANASTQAAAVQAQSQQEALNYLKEVEKVPQQFRQEALTKLGGLSGLDGGTGSQQELIDRAKASPLYASIMGGRKEGEGAIMRNAAATGGLRGGNVQGAMYDYNTNLSTAALLQSYNQQLQGLQGLALLPSNAGNIASSISSVGTTTAGGILGAGTALSQGQIAAAQAQQQGSQNTNNTLMGGLGTLLKYGVI